MEEYVKKECKKCCGEFIPKRKHQEFCSPHCRDAWNNKRRMDKVWDKAIDACIEMGQSGCKLTDFNQLKRIKEAK